MPNAGRPRAQRRKDARPSEIIDAGIDEFAEHGFERARLDRIAKAAGIAKGTIYLYYESKEALFLAAAEKHVIEVLAENETTLAGFQGTTAELLTHLLTAIYDQFVDGRAQTLLKIMVAEGDRIPKVVERYHAMAIQRGTSLLRTILERGVARGEVDPSPIVNNPQVVIAPAIFYAIHSMVFQMHGPIDRDSFIAAHTEMMLHGVLKRQSQQSRP
ncbi:TetR/AcrR family transcriptional regulator [Yoonia litorea]|uniref:Transcriptional regulator, TetR family n=1 Tax=Yoonia litorea TaxID=1123755 RepID=A0A1I6MW99_9RHOB|nr:TetR/AcrR family transcriptional regulator [Yoonia litorea]SFS19993.1 transcriptional regulator, TetR family [Yoonia litorea]